MHLIKYFLRLVTCCFLCVFINSKLSAQQEDSSDKPNNQLVISGRVHYGFIFAHSIYVKNTADAKPRGFELEMAKQFSDEKNFQRFRCYPRTGLMFSYIDYDKSFLGNSYSASYFLQPIYRIGDRWTASLRGVMGLSYLTKPYDSVTNRQNQSYSGHINAFLQLGAGISYDISNRISINTSANFFHNSNTGFKQPNRGVNYPNVSLAVNYFSKTNHLPKYKLAKDTSWKHEPVEFEAGFLYSPKSGYDNQWNSERKFLGGVMFLASKKISNISAITLSTEAYYDGAMKSIKNNIGDNTSTWFVGVLAGHEFVFNKFIFSQQLGMHVYKRTDYYDDNYHDVYNTLYHRWGLRYVVTPHIYAGFNLLAHAQTADFIDARILYKF